VSRVEEEALEQDNGHDDDGWQQLHTVHHTVIRAEPVR
jgi:hypothetical protein